ncbi:MAG: four helix bundle protein [Chitinophagaceae bacterium]|jgi:four helix bundle protein
MATITNFEDLKIFKKARVLNKQIISLARLKIPKTDFRFISQIISSSGSVMDNIAEGFERDSRLEFVNFLSFAKGSTGETRSQLVRGIDMEYWLENDVKELSVEFQNLAKDIANFIRYLNKSNIKGQKFKDRINPNQ